MSGEAGVSDGRRLRGGRSLAAEPELSYHPEWQERLRDERNILGQRPNNDLVQHAVEPFEEERSRAAAKETREGSGTVKQSRPPVAGLGYDTGLDTINEGSIKSSLEVSPPKESHEEVAQQLPPQRLNWNEVDEPTTVSTVFGGAAPEQAPPCHEADDNTLRAVEDYFSGRPSHLDLRKGDPLILTHPEIKACDGNFYFRGQKLCGDRKQGWFPNHLVKKPGGDPDPSQQYVQERLESEYDLETDWEHYRIPDTTKHWFWRTSTKEYFFAHTSNHQWEKRIDVQKRKIWWCNKAERRVFEQKYIPEHQWEDEAPDSGNPQDAGPTRGTEQWT